MSQNCTNESSQEIKIITPIGMLGYGFSTPLLISSILTHCPDAIIMDSGSTDSGPQKLALGQTTTPKASYVRDFTVLLAVCHKYKLPVIISSCGGDGSNDHVDLFLNIVNALSEKHGYSFKVLTLYTEVPKPIILQHLAAGKVSPCGPVHALTPELLNETPRVVAQIGHESILAAMESHPNFDIILTGRAYDPAPYAAFCSFKSGGRIGLGVSYHMGKIMECGGLCAVPKCKSALATVREDSFDITPLDEGARCTTLSVAAHTLYEKARPDILLGPGGCLDLTASDYKELPDGKSVKVQGGLFVPAPTGKYTLKLEGARSCGYRSIFIGGIRDPILIAQIEGFLQKVEKYVTAQNPDVEYKILFHTYGKNGVMGAFEPVIEPSPHELCIIGEIQAETQELATLICSTARVACVHGPYPGQLATAGNLAMPFSPLDIEMGTVCEFSVYHLMVVEDPDSFVKTVVVDINSRNKPRIEYEDIDGQSAAGPEKNSVHSAPPPSPPVPEKTNNNSKPIYLSDAAKVIRSKNAGPFELTLDVMFPATSAHIYHKIKAADPPVLSAGVIAELYQMKGREDEVVAVWWDQALAFKATIPRPRPSGGFGERDVHASQFHVPLLGVKVDHLNLE
ncbi:hypothetical protein DFP73DRAFT_507243 [Morchella snyderi]|nr:hypothetical protein DFP73DRAFT_507243 [Morchella snyderi]